MKVTWTIEWIRDYNLQSAVRLGETPYWSGGGEVLPTLKAAAEWLERKLLSGEYSREYVYRFVKHVDFSDKAVLAENLALLRNCGALDSHGQRLTNRQTREVSDGAG